LLFSAIINYAKETGKPQIMHVSYARVFIKSKKVTCKLRPGKLLKLNKYIFEKLNYISTLLNYSDGVEFSKKKIVSVLKEYNKMALW